MSSIENRNFGADIPTTSQKDFVNGVYSSVDKATASGRDRLGGEDGIIATCKLGCCHCCRQHVLTNIAEAHNLAQYVRRELSVDQINGLRMRTQQWHAWDNSRPGGYPSADIGEQTDLSDYDPCCPLPVNDTCSAYPVRPVVCRTHFVCSHPLSCFAANDPESKEDAPVKLTSVVTATRPFSMAISGSYRNHRPGFFSVNKKVK